ncbi:MAG TPA: hypothetical protein VGZ90_16090 [Puia sp.]|jgi:hypothetical protein|nr:hypothetical protein [Puia sp.]
MKKICLVSFIFMALIFNSCHNNSSSSAKPVDSSGTIGTGSVDSSANNGIVPPSASPDNATNSSLADTAYKAKDSSKTK